MALLFSLSRNPVIRGPARGLVTSPQEIGSRVIETVKSRSDFPWKGMVRWKNKVALVTGASEGIGAATCRLLATNGMIVLGVSRNTSKVEKMAAELRRSATCTGRLSHFSADVSKEEDLRSLFMWAARTLGGVDVLVNNAGMGVPGSIINGDVCSWRRMMDVNVVGLAVCSSETVRSLESRKALEGYIINICSVAGHVMTSFDDLQMYHVSKYAVTALTEVYRRELKSRSVPIRVSQISPGLVRTEFVRNLYKEHPQKEEKVARYFPDIKLLTSEDIAQTVLYCLASPPHMQVHDIIMRPRGQLI